MGAMEIVGLGLAWYLAFLFSTTVHEAAHAWAALRLGDPTAYQGGQVTLDPIPHIRREPFGTVVMPILSYVVSGWMMGWASAPYDPHWAMRHPRKAAWMALAGPVANLLIAVAAGILIHAGVWVGVFAPPDTIRFTQVVEAVHPWAYAVGVLLSILFTLNLLLFTFNLIPLPPLDGSSAAILLMSEQTANRYQEFLMNNAYFGMLGLIIAWQVFDPLFDPVFTLALRLLYPGAGYG